MTPAPPPASIPAVEPIVGQKDAAVVKQNVDVDVKKDE